MAEKKEDKKEEVKKAEVEVVEITATTQRAFKLPDGTIVDADNYFVWLGNLVYKISKNLG